MSLRVRVHSTVLRNSFRSWPLRWQLVWRCYSNCSLLSIVQTSWLVELGVNQRSKIAGLQCSAMSSTHLESRWWSNGISGFEGAKLLFRWVILDDFDYRIKNNIMKHRTGSSHLQWSIRGVSFSTLLFWLLKKLLILYNAICIEFIIFL